MKLLDFINQNTNDAYKDFKLVSVIFDENDLSCTFKFLYKDSIKDNARTELSELIKKYFNDDINVIVKCKKAYIDCDLVRDIIFNFISKNYNSLGINFDKNNINVQITDVIDVSIICDSFQYSHIHGTSIEQEIVSYAKSFFFEEFSLSVILDHEEVDQTEEEFVPEMTFDLTDSSAPNLKFNKVENLEQYIGEVRGNPVQIACIKSAMENVEVAGLLKFLSQKSFESKRKDKEGNPVLRIYYNFVIFDGTARINCVYFPNKADLIKAEGLEENKNIIVHGDIEDYNGRLSFKVKSIGFADVVLESVESEEVKIISSPNDRYLTVKPEAFVDIFQDNMFFEKKEVGEYLLNNDIVVFDIETTGLEASRCEILEIGAVKLKQGKIVETFETLIKPESEIPDEITKLTGITADMVAKSPNIKQVLPDFYKFCYGCTIMAYNIDFDYKFISVWGQKQGYVFDNKQIDVLYLARAYIPGLKNFKLSTVCKKLGISLENAHRAVHDAMATAEVVIELGTNIT